MKKEREITFKDLQKKVRLNSPQILKVIEAILRHEHVDRAALSVVFVSHQRIKALNKKFLNRDHVTDVLAFDHCDNGSIKQKPRAIAGDIIISTDAALKNMKTYKTALPQELALYIVHGILHLLGYDDHKAGGIKRMRSKEQEILKSLGTKINKVVK